MSTASRPPKPIPAERLLATFASARGVSVAALKAPGRTMPLAHVRQEAYAFVRANRTDLSTATIARLFGNRNHATILRGIEAATARGYAPGLVRANAPAPALSRALRDALVWHETRLAMLEDVGRSRADRVRRAGHAAQAEMLRAALGSL